MWNFIANMWRGITGMNEAYDEGYEAFGLGYIPVDNPYQEGTYAFAQWEAGYLKAENECPRYMEELRWK